MQTASTVPNLQGRTTGNRMVDLTWGHQPRYTARELTDLLEDHKPANKRLYPTDEQTAIIEAGRDPLLVVAGAGSGKTHTMTERVIWLIANGYVRPEEVLGVTFTRKAAGELESRINNAIEHLAERDDIALDFDTTDIGQAAVTTYHSYANSLVADHGLRIGVEPDARLIGEAESHQLLTEVVRANDSDIDLTDVRSSLLLESPGQHGVVRCPVGSLTGSGSADRLRSAGSRGVGCTGTAAGHLSCRGSGCCFRRSGGDRAVRGGLAFCTAMGRAAESLIAV